MSARTVSIGLFAAAVVAFVTVAAGAISIETVPVGNTGNIADTAYHSGNTAGQGEVSYAYNIGKYEVTAGQYTAFLNAAAGVDTYHLYTFGMSSTSYGSGIKQKGSGTAANPYTYTVDPAFVNRPVNYVSFWDACRFANWLNNGQQTAQQDPTVTEHGAYTLTPDGINNNTVVRNADWKWAIASEDEWYKAAYHKNDGNTANYFTYPTKSDTAPGRNLADPLPGNNANYYGSPYPIQSPYYTTIAGQFQNSPSPYGTFDQGGNVWEWNEAIVSALWRGLRGGSLEDDHSDYLASSYRNQYGYTADESSDVGFRVVSVPESGGIASLLIAAAAGLIWWRHRK